MNTIMSAVGAASCLSIMGMFSDIGNKKDVTLKFDLMKMVGAIMSGCVRVVNFGSCIRNNLIKMDSTANIRVINEQLVGYNKQRWQKSLKCIHLEAFL